MAERGNTSENKGSQGDGTLRRYWALLLLFFIGLAGACFIILLFFRTDLFVRGAGWVLNILTPFIVGVAIAYIMRPFALSVERGLTKLQDRFLKKKHPGFIRMASIVVAVVVLLAVIVLLLIAVLPEVITSLARIARSIPGAYTQLVAWLDGLDQYEPLHEAIGGLEEVLGTLSGRLRDFLNNSVVPYLESLVGGLTTSFVGIFNIVKNFGLGLIISCYLLSKWEKFMAQAKLLVYGIFPKRAADWIRREVRYTDRMFSGFIHGKLLDSAIIGLICFVFCALVNMPYAMLISVVVGVTNIIPFFGPYLGAIPSLLLLLTVNPGKCLLFLIFIVLLQQFDGNILGPAILGDRLGISGIWILFSILFFSALWGIVGMLIGVPLFAVLYDLIRRFVVSSLRRRNETDMLTDYQERFAEDEPPKKAPKLPKLPKIKTPAAKK